MYLFQALFPFSFSFKFVVLRFSPATFVFKFLMLRVEILIKYQKNWIKKTISLQKY